MRITNKVRKETWVLYYAAALVMAVVMLLFCNGLSIVSNAAEGKVTGTSVRIRKEASTSSDVVGSATSGETFTINSEVQGADGKIWYQITKAGVTGYIRSDLMEKTEGTGAEPTVTVNPSVAVTEVTPIEGTVTNGSQVRVRTDASTESGSIITYVSDGTKVTVKGQANGTDGKVWYLVIFNGNSGTVEGFIRSDYISVSGQLTPVDPTTPPEGTDTPSEPTVEPEVPKQNKLYETRLGNDGVWYLQDYSKDPGEEWDVAKLLEDYKENAGELIADKGRIKTQKIVIIILVVLLIAAILAATLLYFKIKDISDEAYFSAVEKETIRERNAMRANDPRASGSSRMQTISRQSEGSTLNSRPVTQGQAGNRPMSQNPVAKNASATAKPNSQVRPAQNPAQAKGQTMQQQAPQAKPAQPTAQPRQGAVNQARPAQNPAQVRPAQAGGVQTKPAQSTLNKGAAPVAPQMKAAGQPSVQQNTAGQFAEQNKQAALPKDQNWKKKISDEDDEFEFEFLNWDGDEK